jgi:hypothetical protein
MELQKITTPVNSNFVLKNGKGKQTDNGMYFHFSDVVSLIKLARKLQHEETKKACAENAKIKLYNEDLSGKEIDIYETNNYIECAKEMNSFAEISKESILSSDMPDIY